MKDIPTSDMERLQQKVQDLEERLAQLEPPGPPRPVWKDVTAECEMEWDGVEGQWVITHNDIMACPYNGYRVSRISGPLSPHVAFIVEKKE